ncbi:MAG: type II secretion system protein [Candidatus Brocadiaceae bacterium]|nr:type II secretion system protein [Candidatus Brocadiaceae bacterium]
MHVERNVAGRAAFTLVELLVVITIIAVLAGLLTPAIIAAMNRSGVTVTVARIRQCELAATAFFNDYGQYPPMHWDELAELFDYNDIDGHLDGLDTGTEPSTINEGIEVFVACLASRTGGPYLQPEGDWLRNVDVPDDLNAAPDDRENDTLQNDVAQATNWYFGGRQIFEIVDYWGNPLVYVHNRYYADYDGWDEENDVWYAPATGTEALPYADVDGVLQPCYARSYYGTTTDNHPNLNTFQLFSWGLEGMAGCDEDGGLPVPTEPGWLPGWWKKSGKLTNWEE